jgi:error-prone DNA polymerase
LVAGKTRRTGVRGVSVMAENAWDLKDLYRDWRKRKDAEASNGNGHSDQGGAGANREELQQSA